MSGTAPSGHEVTFSVGEHAAHVAPSGPPRTAPDTNPVPTLCPECARVVVEALAGVAPELRAALGAFLAGSLRRAG